ncbi:MAG: hypothetical protein IJP96_09955 [Synergistaceae bacterium]|nr:hypothetical protein [Synergistaceae bacterium]
MPKMRIVTDEMLNRANRIGQNTTNILEKQNMVTNLFKNMGKNFSGKIPGLMTQHMLAMDKEYQTMNGILTNYRDFLEDSAHNYEWKEDELANFAATLGNSGTNANGNSGSTGTIGTAGNTASSNTSESTQDNSYTPSAGTTGGWDASGGWDTVGDDFPNPRPNLDSIYYRGDNPEGIQRAYHKYGKGHPGHIDCCFYARSRAMERNGWTQTYGTFTQNTDPEAIKIGDRVVRFDLPNGGNHFVYVEKYDPTTDTVYFSDANMTNHEDGLLQSMSFNEFKTFGNYGWSYGCTECP